MVTKHLEEHLHAIEQLHKKKICDRLKQSHDLFEGVCQMHESLMDLKRMILEHIEEERAEVREFKDSSFDFDHDLFEWTRPEEGEENVVLEGIDDIEEGDKDDDMNITMSTEDCTVVEEEEEDDKILQEEEEDDLALTGVNIVCLEGKIFKEKDTVMITGGTKYGTSNVCMVKKVTPKTVWLCDTHGNEFRKNKAYVKKIKVRTKTNLFVN